VKAFFDTSILVATFYGSHERHSASIDLVARFSRKEACCATHTLAEIYATLTGRTGKDRVSGDQALLFLGNVRERLTLITLNQEEYFKVLEGCAALGVAGGGIYDALLAHCAIKANAESIYTWNVKDFAHLGPEISGRVRTP
jgi:predicted nucleic acid-binding protein